MSKMTDLWGKTCGESGWVGVPLRAMDLMRNYVGLTYQEMFAVIVIAHHCNNNTQLARISMDRLSRIMGMARTNMSRVINALKEKGIIEISRDYGMANQYSLAPLRAKLEGLKAEPDPDEAEVKEAEPPVIQEESELSLEVIIEKISYEFGGVIPKEEIEVKAKELMDEFGEITSPHYVLKEGIAFFQDQENAKALMMQEDGQEQ